MNTIQTAEQRCYPHFLMVLHNKSDLCLSLNLPLRYCLVSGTYCALYLMCCVASSELGAANTKLHCNPLDFYDSQIP